MIYARFSPKAGQDLEDIFNYIGAENPEAAERVHRTILNTADLLAQYPELGKRICKASARYQQIRWFMVPRFRNYLIFYQPFKKTIMVIRILHAAQDWTRFFPAS